MLVGGEAEIASTRRQHDVAPVMVEREPQTAAGTGDFRCAGSINTQRCLMGGAAIRWRWDGSSWGILSTEAHAVALSDGK